MSTTVSVIVPVLDEGERINALVDHLRVLGYGRQLEILVADGHPEATTLAALDRPGVLRLSAPPGRALQMNAAARQARGDILVFLHADCRLPQEAFGEMERLLGDDRLAGGAFALAIDAPGWQFSLIARMANFRTRLTRLPYGDQAVFLRREAFHALGGFSDLPLLEDVDLVLRLRRAGMRLSLSPLAVTASARRWLDEGVWRRTLTNWAIMALYTLGVPPARLVPLYRTHRPLEGDS